MLVLILLGMMLVSVGVSGQEEPVLCLSGEIVGDDGLCVAGVTDVCLFEDAPLLETINPPRLADGVAGNGELTLKILQDLTTARRVTSIRLGASDGSAYASNPACHYGVGPGSVHWTKGTGTPRDECLDFYESSIPWSTVYAGDAGGSAAEQIAAGACGLERTEDAEYVIFTGAATMTFEDSIGALRGVGQTRVTESVLKFRVKFVKEASVSTNVVIFDDPRLVSAVTEQIWNGADTRGEVALTTSLQWPFQATGAIVIQDEEGVTMTSIGIDDTKTICPDDGTSPCFQTFDFHLGLNSTTCRLDGEYSVSLTLACQDTVTGAACPLNNSGNPTTSVSFTLASEDVCGVVEGVVGVQLALTSHRSFDSLNFLFGELQSAYLQSDTMYFRLVCDSNENGFGLAETTLESVTGLRASDGAEVTLLNDDGMGGGETSGISFVRRWRSTSATEHEHEFEFVPAVPVFGEAPVDGSAISTITAVVSVVFADTGMRKRFVLEANVMEDGREYVEASHRVGLSASASVEDELGEVPGGGSGGEGDEDPTRWPVFVGIVSVMGVVLLMCCTCVGVGMMAMMVMNKKKKEKESKLEGVTISV